MPKPTKGPRLGSNPTHQKLMLGGLARQLFLHDRITTTEAKAKRLRPLAESLITKAKKGDLHNRRLVLKTVTDKEAVHRLFTEIAEMMKDRPGGYTRITKIGPRKGDNAPMAVIELVNEELKPKTTKAAKSEAPVEKDAKEESKAVAEDAEVAETEVETADAESEETEVATVVSESTEAKAAETAEAETEK